ncbi:MAG: tail fiber domain-containing protein, partial [Candidatus Zixiibacteriota bacterium]
GDWGTIGGGLVNATSGLYSTVSGGRLNASSFHFATVGGGNSNTASSAGATISGGAENIASGFYSTVGGGQGDSASGHFAVVSGGSGNVATDSGTTVGGGWHNRAAGRFSTVPGGEDNSATGNYSFAAGFGAKAIHDGTFVWADSHDAVPFSSSGSNQFLISAAGGVGINTNTPNGMLTIKASGTQAGIHFNGGAQDVTWMQGQRLQFGTWNGITFTEMMQIDAVGYVGIGTPTPSEKLHVVGNICYTGSISACSDRRYKQDIRTIEGALDKVSRIRGVRFSWKRQQFNKMSFPDGSDVGVIAQEVEQVLPEIVSTNEDGYKSVDYTKLTPLLIEAMKEQQQTIADLQQRLSKLESHVTDKKGLQSYAKTR